MKIFKSDAWDSGNHLTRFCEVIRECEDCHGEGEIINPEAKGGSETCPDCKGDKEVVYYE